MWKSICHMHEYLEKNYFEQCSENVACLVWVLQGSSISQIIIGKAEIQWMNGTF